MFINDQGNANKGPNLIQKTIFNLNSRKISGAEIVGNEIGFGKRVSAGMILRIHSRSRSRSAQGIDSIPVPVPGLEKI